MEEKYKVLVNYLKLLLEKSYVDKNEILTILKALEEVE